VENRKLGNSTINVSALSLGSWNTFSRLSFESGAALIEKAYKAGINFFDVAYYRDKPHTEVLFGRELEQSGVPRDDISIASKVWFFSYPEESLSDQFDRNLVRLGLDQTETLICEHPRDGMEVVEIAEEMGEIVQSGRTKTWGCLNWKAEDLLTAYRHNKKKGYPVPTIVQLKYSLVRRNVVEGSEYQSVLEETGIGVHASDSLEGGILTGRINRERKIGLDIGGIRQQIIDKVPKITEAAEKLGVTPAQFGLAFVLSSPQVSSLLFGATTEQQILDNVEAVKLAQEKSEDIRTLAEGLGVDGHEIDPPYGHDKALTDDFVA